MRNSENLKILIYKTKFLSWTILKYKKYNFTIKECIIIDFFKYLVTVFHWHV